MTTRSSALALPSGINWEKIETPHFSIIYDSRQYELAAVYARAAEDAFEKVSPLFGEWPAKTVVLIDDTTDIANGSATGVPYPMITVYPVLPNSIDSVSDYGSWSTELLIHEYTHILNFEPADGLVRPLRYVFGSIMRPNMLLPRWYSEGLAVEIETRLSHHGRLRSRNYLAIVRAMAEENTLRREDIARVNETSIPDWLGGARPYLLGALLMDEVVLKGGTQIISDLNHAYARRMPYFINGPVEDRFGLGYQELLEQTYDRIERMATKQLTTIAAADPAFEAAVNQKGFFSHSPVISPDQRHLAYIAKQHNVDSAIFVVDRSTSPANASFDFPSEPKSAATGKMINRASWFPDSKRLVHDGIETFERDYLYSDLWILDLETKEDRQITHGLRAHEPTVSADGLNIVFVQTTPGSTALATLRADGSGTQALMTPPPEHRISRPEFLNDKQIVFVERNARGNEVIKLLNLKKTQDGRLEADGEAKVVLADFQPVHDPRLTAKGLIFVSERSGISNLYLADSSLRTARALTNTRTRAMTGEFDVKQGDLYYSRLFAAGPQLVRVPEATWSRAEKRPPNVTPLVEESELTNGNPPELQRDEQVRSTPQTELRREPYSPWWYLLPRFWMPYAYFGPGISYYSASTSAADPTMRHSYSLNLTYDTLTGMPSFFGSYANNTTRVPLKFTALNSYDYVYSGGYRRQFTDVTGMGEINLPGRANDWKSQIGWESSTTRVPGSSLRRSGPQAQLSYSSLRQRGLEISPEKGAAAVISNKQFLAGMSDLAYDVTDIRLSKYWSGGILPERHVFALFANASLAPRLTNPLFGVSTISANYQTLPGVNAMVMRGYNSGVFIGRNILTASAEYRLPLSYEYKGFSTKPFFIRRWHAGLFVDALTLDGKAYDFTRRGYNEEKIGFFYYGTGVDFKLDATLFYHLPLQIIFGWYYGLDPRANSMGLFPVLSLGI